MKKLYQKIRYEIWLLQFKWSLFKLRAYTLDVLRCGTVRQIEEVADTWIKLAKTQSGLDHIVERAESWKESASQIVMKRVFKR